MWKYINSKDCTTFLLSLNLLNGKNDRDYIKTLYSISNNIKSNYNIYYIKKRSGKLRKIYEPNLILKNIQRRILINILENKKTSEYAKAYKKGLSLIDNAIVHVNKEIILKLDIKNFFDNITFFDVYNNCFSIEYFPKSIGYLLTYLCTYDDHLIQGTPTSSYISNLVMRDFDEEIGLFCKERDISYTRYSDDMTFSGSFNVKEIIILVRKLLMKKGLSLNDKKTCVIKRDKCQSVTGIIVNDKVNINSKYKRKIRQEVYYLLKNEKEHFKRNNINDKEKYLIRLLGKINYCLQINPNNQEFIKYKEELIKKINVKGTSN